MQLRNFHGKEANKWYLIITRVISIESKLIKIVLSLLLYLDWKMLCPKNVWVFFFISNKSKAIIVRFSNFDYLLYISYGIEGKLSSRILNWPNLCLFSLEMAWCIKFISLRNFSIYSEVSIFLCAMYNTIFLKCYMVCVYNLSLFLNSNNNFW